MGISSGKTRKLKRFHMTFVKVWQLKMNNYAKTQYSLALVLFSGMHIRLVALFLSMLRFPRLATKQS